MSQQIYIFIFLELKSYIFYWDIKHRAVGPCLSRATDHGGGPGTARYVGPCLSRATDHGGGPGTARYVGPCRPGPGSSRAVPCPGRAKMTGRGPGQRATGRMAIYGLGLV